MKKIFSLLVALSFLAVCRADSFMSLSRANADLDMIYNLSGNYGILLLSTTNDLLVSSENGNIIATDRLGKDKDGHYQTMVTVGEKNPGVKPILKLRVSHQGGIDYCTQTIQLSKPDYAEAWQVVDVASPIRYEVSDGADVRNLNNTQAMVEFNTTIDDLKVEWSDLYGADDLIVKRGTRTGDASVHYTRIIVPITALQTARENLEQKKAERQKYDQMSVDDQVKHINAIDQLDAQIEEAERTYGQLTTLTISAPGSNTLTVDISDLAPLAKKEVAVLPIQVEVASSEAVDYMNRGRELFDIAKFEDARENYVHALNAATEEEQDIRHTIQTNIDLCDACITERTYANKAVNEYMRMKKEGGHTQQEVVAVAREGYFAFKRLNEMAPQEKYTRFMDVLDSIQRSLPIKFRFTTVLWTRDLMEGGPVSGVEIFYYRNETLDKKRRLREEDRVVVGVTDAQGKAEVEFPRDNPPKVVYFSSPSREVSTWSQTMDNMMRESSGNYMERQQRIRLRQAK